MGASDIQVAKGKGTAKADNAIEVPTTPEIEAAIKMAGNDKARPNDTGTGPNDLIFPRLLE